MEKINTMEVDSSSDEGDLFDAVDSVDSMTAISLIKSHSWPSRSSPSPSSSDSDDSDDDDILLGSTGKKRGRKEATPKKGRPKKRPRTLPSLSSPSSLLSSDDDHPDQPLELLKDSKGKRVDVEEEEEEEEEDEFSRMMERVSKGDSIINQRLEEQKRAIESQTRLRSQNKAKTQAQLQAKTQAQAQAQAIGMGAGSTGPSSLSSSSSSGLSGSQTKVFLFFCGSKEKFRFSFDNDTPVRGVIKNFCELNKMDLKDARVELDGSVIDINQTPRELHLHEDDEIEIFDSKVSAKTSRIIDALSSLDSGPPPSGPRISVFLQASRTRLPFSIGMKENFRRMHREYCVQTGQSEESVGFRFDGESLNLDSSPEALDLEGDEVIDVIVGAPSKKITVFLQVNRTRSPFTIDMKEPFRKVHKEYCAQTKQSELKVHLKFDGQNLNLSSTPSSLDLEGDEIIDVLIK